MGHRKYDIGEFPPERRVDLLAMSAERLVRIMKVNVKARNLQRMMERLEREKAQQESKHNAERARLIGLLEKAMKISQIDNKFPVKNKIGFQIDVEALQRAGCGGALLFFDVDGFKQINTTYGHLDADKTLGVLAKWLNTHFRASDVVSRWGGDEFVIFCPNSTPKKIHEKLNGKINVPVVITSESGKDISIDITVSGGMVTLTPNQKIDDALRKANKIMYNAKQDGKNRIYIEESDE